MLSLERVLCCLLATVVVIASGCNETKPPIAKMLNAQSKRIYAVSYPLQFLTQQIAGDEIEVLVPFAIDDDPCAFRPSRDVISQMQTADLIIANGTGATYANWLDTVSLPDSKIVNSASRGLSLKEYIAIENASVVHSHGPEGEHSHPVMASRTWLDPALAKKQSVYIEKQLARVYPDKAETFSANLKLLTAKLDRLSEILEKAKPADSTVVLSINSKFKFFSRAAGLSDKTVVGFEAGSDSIPSLDVLKSALEKQLEGLDPKPSTILIDQTQNVDQELLDSIVAMGLNPIVIDPLDHQPTNGDYLSIMEKNIERISTRK